jgi:hypothetical protein
LGATARSPSGRGWGKPHHGHGHIWEGVLNDLVVVSILALFGWVDKPAEKYCWLICCERKILFQLKKQAEKDGL